MLAAARFPCFYESIFQQPGSFLAQQLNAGYLPSCRVGERLLKKVVVGPVDSPEQNQNT
jgi:hypothetical protein